VDFKPAILLVDGNGRNLALLSAFLNDAGYRTYGVSVLEEFDRFLDGLDGTPDTALALVDLAGFDASVWERCRRLHDAGIAFVVIARAQSIESGNRVLRKGHGAGAAYTLTKPMRKEQLLTLVRILTGTDD
jgi:DNA-binding response OmpR family regulator